MTNGNDGETGMVLMLNKKERKFVRALLGKLLSSKGIKEVIKKQLGEDYIEIAYRLLETMGGSKIRLSALSIKTDKGAIHA